VKKVWRRLLSISSQKIMQLKSVRKTLKKNLPKKRRMMVSLNFVA